MCKGQVLVISGNAQCASSATSATAVLFRLRRGFFVTPQAACAKARKLAFGVMSLVVFVTPAACLLIIYGARAYASRSTPTSSLRSEWRAAPRFARRTNASLRSLSRYARSTTRFARSVRATHVRRARKLFLWKSPAAVGILF